MPVALPGGIAFDADEPLDRVGVRLQIRDGLQLDAERRRRADVAGLAARGRDLERRLVGDGFGRRRRLVRLERERKRDRTDRGHAQQVQRHPPAVHEVEEVPDDDEDREDREQGEPGAVAAEGEREVAREHREDDRQRQVVVVHGALLRAQPRCRIRLPALLLGANELPVRGDDDEEDVGGHDRAEDGADLEIGRTRCEELAREPGDGDDEQRGRDRDAEVVPQEPAGELVDEQAAEQEQRRSADRLPGRQVGDGRVDQPCLGVRPVEEDEQREAGEPRRVGLPLEPVQRLREDARGDLVLLRVVEAAAVHAPVLAGDALVEVGALGGRRQSEVEADEVERRADPRDPGDHVQEAEDEVGDLPQVVRVHRSLGDRDQLPHRRVELLLAGARDALAQHVEDLRLRPAVDEDDEPEAELLLVDLVLVGELRQHRRVGVLALLRRRAGREAAARTDGRVCVERLDLLLLAERVDHLVRPLERVVELGEPLDERRPALEELGQLVDAQLPR